MGERLVVNCPACVERIKWFDDVISTEDGTYHKECVQVYPSTYVVFLDGDFLGESLNDDGSSADEILEFGMADYEEEA